MATDKIVYINDTQVAPRVLSADVLASGVYRNLVEIDMGKVARKVWEDERPLLDGMRRRGSVFGQRDMTWKIRSMVNVAAVGATAIEQVRDSERDALLNLLLSGDLLELKVSGKRYNNQSVSRIIYADAGEIAAWQWQKTSLGDGYVGRHDMPVGILSVPFHCPFPWWADEAATATAELTLDATLRTTTVTNTGHVPCGLKFNVEGSAAGPLTVHVANATLGAQTSIVGPGVTLQDITLHATNGWSVDQYVDDPQAFLAYREADESSILSYLAARPRVWLAKGENTISYQITDGTPAGGETIQFSHRNWWGTP